MAMTVFSFAQVQKIDNLQVNTTLTPPLVTKVQMDALTPAAGLMVYCTDCVPAGLYVNNGGTFLSQQTFVASDAGVVLAAGEVLSPTGKVWMDKNLGATQVATSSTDVDSYGDLYQWGRNTDGHEIRTSAVVAGPAADATAAGSDFISNATTPFDWLDTPDDTLWNGAVKGAEDPCPTGYRVPTNTELNNELLLFTSNNSVGAFASALKLPVAGFRYHDTGTLTSVGTYGYYWSSTFTGTNAHILRFYSDASMSSSYRTRGYSVRCIKE
ncbi:fibrobacter succinogenes major paralogous domain-containing protein [Flavobacteriaceae bacterium]|nr:fibrobacter succinogenes major paralogous domain-containing protein [Flavobacteriaceae bacterium]